MEDLQIFNAQKSLHRALLQDITEFMSHFSGFEFVRYADFKWKWEELDLNLLPSLAPTPAILSCLVDLGLFSPARPLRDHQLLIFFLLFLYKADREPFKLSVDRVHLLLVVRMRARNVLSESTGETVDALETLFRRDAIVITAAMDEQQSNLSKSKFTVSSTSAPAPSMDQLNDRILRIHSFLNSHPLLDEAATTTTNKKIPLKAFTRLRSLFDRYYDAKRRGQMQMSLAGEQEQDFGSTLASLIKIVEGYEKLMTGMVASHPAANTNTNSARSVRSRLSQTSLTPVAANSSTCSFPVDFFVGRSNSVPSTTKTTNSSSSSSSRRPSTLRDINLDEFISSTTNMPDINFY